MIRAGRCWTGRPKKQTKLLLPVIPLVPGQVPAAPSGIYLLVLVSAATVAVMEGTEYAVQPRSTSRCVGHGIVHPLLSRIRGGGRLASRLAGKSIFTAGGRGQVLAMAAHSTNDVIVSQPPRRRVDRPNDQLRLDRGDRPDVPAPEAFRPGRWCRPTKGRRGLATLATGRGARLNLIAPEAAGQMGVDQAPLASISAYMLVGPTNLKP